MKRVKLWDKEFEISYPADEIKDSIERLANAINSDLANEEKPIFISILNGSYWTHYRVELQILGYFGFFS